MTSNVTSSETLDAKCAFECFTAKHGVQIKHYHCDNGRFADNEFCTACEAQQQKLTFYGVNAPFQNGIAEQAICDFLEGARNQLLYARQHWLQPVNTALWPYALCHVAYLDNVLPPLEGGQSKLDLFNSIQVGSNIRLNRSRLGTPQKYKVKKAISPT